MRQSLDMARRVHMTHDVRCRDWVGADTLEVDGDRVTRHEHEKDVTRTWGLRVGYQQPLGEQGWRFGGVLTANPKSNHSDRSLLACCMRRETGCERLLREPTGRPRVTRESQEA